MKHPFKKDACSIIHSVTHPITHPSDEFIEEHGTELRLDQNIFENRFAKNTPEELEVEKIVFRHHGCCRIGKKVLQGNGKGTHNNIVVL